MDFDKSIVDMIPYLNQYSRRFMLSEEDREDLVSNTVLKVLDKRDYFKEGGEGELRAWVCTVMKNIMINDYRKSNNEKTDHYSNEEFQLVTEQKFYSKDSDSDILYEELFETVKSIARPVDFRIFMAYVNGYTYEQISEILEIPFGTVKSRIHFFRKRLINHLANVKDKSWKYS